MSQIRKNGKSYDAGDVVIAMFGSLSYEVTEITYATEQEHQLQHSLGTNDPTSYGMGKKTHSGTVTIRIASISAIEKAAGGNLLNIKPFEINVTFTNEDNDIINDTLLVKFQDQGRDVPSEMDLKRQFTMFVLDINYNNA